MMRDNTTYYKNLEFERKRNIVLYTLNNYFPKPETFEDLDSFYSPFPFLDFEQTHPLNLPKEIITNIFEFCDRSILKRCSESCKLFFNASRALRIWTKFGVIENQDDRLRRRENGLLLHVSYQKERFKAMENSLNVFENERNAWRSTAYGSHGRIKLDESFEQVMMSEFQKTFRCPKAECFLFEKAYGALKKRLENRIISKELAFTREDVIGQHVTYNMFGGNTVEDVDEYRFAVDFHLHEGAYRGLKVRIWIKCIYPYPHATFEILSETDIFHPLFNKNEERYKDEHFRFDVYISTIGNIMGELQNNMYLENAFETVEKCLLDPTYKLDRYRGIRNEKARLALSDHLGFRKFLLKSFGKK